MIMQKTVGDFVDMLCGEAAGAYPDLLPFTNPVMASITIAHAISVPIRLGFDWPGGRLEWSWPSCTSAASS